MYSAALEVQWGNGKGTPNGSGLIGVLSYFARRDRLAQSEQNAAEPPAVPRQPRKRGRPLRRTATRAAHR
jgi:hypothetical protein